MLFAQHGALVSVIDINRRGGEATARTITGKGGHATFIPADVMRAEDCKKAIEKTSEELGLPRILVNSAGVIRRASILETSESDWDRTMDVNVKSVFLLARAAIPLMVVMGGGTIVNVGSGWGLRGGSQAAAYCASKGAVVQLTRAMAIDHGRQRIRVNCLCPGDTETPMLLEEAHQLGLSREDVLAQSAERPLGRVGSTREVAEAALFLAGDDSSYITGTTLVVDGGALAG